MTRHLKDFVAGSPVDLVKGSLKVSPVVSVHGLVVWNIVAKLANGDWLVFDSSPNRKRLEEELRLFVEMPVGDCFIFGDKGFIKGPALTTAH